MRHRETVPVLTANSHIKLHNISLQRNTYVVEHDIHPHLHCSPIYIEFRGQKQGKEEKERMGSRASPHFALL